MLKFLIISVGIFYLLKLLVRAMFPFLVQKTYDKMQNEAQTRHNQHQSSQKRQGEVTIQNNNSKQEPTSKKDIGEYVDYEEVN